LAFSLSPTMTLTQGAASDKREMGMSTASRDSMKTESAAVAPARQATQPESFDDFNSGDETARIAETIRGHTQVLFIFERSTMVTRPVDLRRDRPIAHAEEKLVSDWSGHR
jgi:hypothetical protein